MRFLSGVGNRESGVGSRESGIGNRESGIGSWGEFYYSFFIKGHGHQAWNGHLACY
ncbi:MAG: hypothetical protein F6K26_46130 [Moorea sp. SIO2I5]|nr:hypothetical protein [Moorena sp. SIO2I5]